MLRPPVYFGLAIAAFAALVAVSILRIEQARVVGDDEAVRGWSMNLAFSSIALVVILVMFVGRQLPAVVYAAVVSKVGRKPVLVVTHMGSATLHDAAPRRGGVFSRCLVADNDGLQLWEPFKTTSLAWRELETLSAQARVDVPARAIVINVVRTNPAARLLFIPRSSSAIGWDGVKKGEIDQQLDNMKKLRSG